MEKMILMPTKRPTLNLGEFAEDATVIETPKRSPFVEANTQEATLQHLRNDCITPVFSKDN